MTKEEFELIENVENIPFENGWFGIKYLTLDENTRVRFGYSFSELGKTYKLQRKNYFWKSVAWTYDIWHNDKLSDTIIYLFWYEERHKK
jgi:hypothetical protein